LVSEEQTLMVRVSRVSSMNMKSASIVIPIAPICRLIRRTKQNFSISQIHRITLSSGKGKIIASRAFNRH